jgi:hypothetical protein
VAARELQLDRSTVIALGLQGVQLISALVLNEALLGAAYSASDGEVSSAEELHLLGPSGQVGLTLIGLITLLSIASTAAMVWHEELHQRAWVAPVVGIAAGVAACLLAVAGFQPVA